jgi:hypothetical protein
VNMFVVAFMSFAANFWVVCGRDVSDCTVSAMSATACCQWSLFGWFPLLMELSANTYARSSIVLCGIDLEWRFFRGFQILADFFV